MPFTALGFAIGGFVNRRVTGAGGGQYSHQHENGDDSHTLEFYELFSRLLKIA
jgi:hypothetical protein